MPNFKDDNCKTNNLKVLKQFKSDFTWFFLNFSNNSPSYKEARRDVSCLG